MACVCFAKREERCQSTFRAQPLCGAARGAAACPHATRAQTSSLPSRVESPQAKSVRKRNSKEFTSFSEPGKFQLKIKD